METYLVSYEYGSGTVWGYVAASTLQELTAFLPEVDVWEDAPPWLTPRELAGLAALAVIEVDDQTALDALFDNYSEMNAAFAS